MFAVLYFFGWNWSHNVNDGFYGNNDSCGTMSHTSHLGQDDECLGGWNQHNRYGFAQTEQAYTEERSYGTAVSGYTGIWVDPEGR
mmetsp:Transcript_24630/g.65719  ORF Transcript_24630/g.65719 Transcript_24630/m.65719 type:complete len:85 (+) Transcript_24630:51-305(+)